MKLSLEVLTDGKQKGKMLPIGLPQFLIGRDPQCHLRPASPSISKRHCALIQREGRVFLRDFDSTNGTFVNENPVKGEVELKDGDQLRIGPIQFTVRLEAGAPVNRPTPPPPTKELPETKKVNIVPKSKEGATTPIPPTKQPVPAPDGESKTVFSVAGAEKADSAEDDIAAMLMSMGDDESAGLSSDVVPEGSTVMDLTLPPGALDAPGAKKEKESEKPKPAPNTSSAAKEILDKYLRRPREAKS
jgi:pSer/pThr/pTyr-binding forkhead associated (FHA) protein